MLTLIRAIQRFLIVLLTTGLLLGGVASAASTTTSSNSASKSSTTTTSSTNASSQVTQGYGTVQNLQKGMIVKLVDKDATKVEALTTATIDKMFGVVVAANDATFALANNGNSGQVFVATNGNYDVLVSNQNGPIKSGDYITISALAGIGMKDDTISSVIVGRATSAFDGSSGVSGTATLKDTTGQQIKVSIGRVGVDLSVGHNPLQQTGTKIVPSFLREAAQYISGKPLDGTRIYIALVVLLATAFLSGAMLYSGIRGGLISIGRNPMAKKQIVAGIVRVTLLGIIVFLIGLFGVYLLLKL